MGRYIRLNYYDESQRMMIEPLLEEGAVVYFHSETIKGLIHLARDEEIKERFLKQKKTVVYTWPEFLGLRYKSKEELCEYHAQKIGEMK